MIDSFDMLFYTLAFIVPGFILYSVTSMCIPQKSEDVQLSLIRFIMFSSINYAVWSWLIYLINVNQDYVKEHRIIIACAWTIIIFISPVLLGLLIGKLSNKDIIRRFMRVLGFNPVHPIPTAWDYKFSKTDNAVWVLVTLNDGSTVAGFFGKNSFASSEHSERDIYIEKVYSVSEDGEWTATMKSNGILICGEQIKHIEFWHAAKREDNYERQN